MGTQMNLLGNIPKEYGFSEITDKQTRRAEKQLNNCPRKDLDTHQIKR